MNSNCSTIDTMIKEKIEIINSGLPEKAVAVYNGVLKLCDEKAELSDVKVSDIAKKAGVGKGTIYDYFNNKEEIIAKALVYNINIEKIKLDIYVSMAETFSEKMRASSQWLKANSQRHFVICNLLHINYASKDMGKALIEQMNKELCGIESYNYIINNIIDSGIREEILKKDVKLIKRDTAIASAVLSMLGYMKNLDRYADMTYDEIEKYSYELFIKIFNS